MNIRVLFFSLLQEALGTAELEITLEEGATVGDALEHLHATHPALREWEGRTLIALDCDYADPDTPLRDGGELALFPPVQGG